MLSASTELAACGKAPFLESTRAARSAVRAGEALAAIVGNGWIRPKVTAVDFWTGFRAGVAAAVGGGGGSSVLSRGV
jgi:hypothetical protein